MTRRREDRTNTSPASDVTASPLDSDTGALREEMPAAVVNEQTELLRQLLAAARRGPALALTYEDAAEVSSLSLSTIRRAVHARELRTVQATDDDRTRRIRPQDLDTWLQRRSSGGDLERHPVRSGSTGRGPPSAAASLDDRARMLQLVAPTSRRK